MLSKPILRAIAQRPCLEAIDDPNALGLLGLGALTHLGLECIESRGIAGIEQQSRVDGRLGAAPIPCCVLVAEKAPAVFGSRHSLRELWCELAFDTAEQLEALHRESNVDRPLRSSV